MNENNKVWSNGNLIPFSEAKVHLLSHGFSRGSGVFEVFGVHPSPDGVLAFRMDNHLERLGSTCNVLGMTLGYNETEIANAVKELVSENKVTNGYVKIMAYFSEVSLSNMVPKDKLDVTIFTFPINDKDHLILSEPVSACISKWRKNHPLSVPPMAKACANYLNGYLARQDANHRGYDIGILLDTHGFVAEGSLESIFIVKNNVLITPPLGRILSSISRKSVIEIAHELGIETQQTPLVPDDLFGNPAEIFFSCTPFKVRPVNQLEDLTFKTPGPITGKIAACLFDVIARKDERFPNWFQVL